ncbi:MFS transporter [Phenylobacterium sp.]|uniref:MFS transporter n=1 Tax=Phenylobacterium sp. TaxID=1871053 RepID=UPI00301C251F
MTAVSPGASQASAASQARAPAQRVPFVTKLFYASGSIGNAIKKGGLASFLLLYYNQVVGLPAAKVATALGVALIVDAVLDPLVGYWSDNVRSRWGRRHPFMYASILPVSIGFVLLWMAPEGWSDLHLTIYMVTLVFVIRVFDTFFEVPAAALLAELTTDYEQRTAIISMRFIFGISGAFGMRMLAYSVLLVPTAADVSGVLNREGFQKYGIIGGMIIFLAILGCCLGTHNQIRHLHRPPVRRPGFMDFLRQVVAIFRNRSMLAAVGGGILLALGAGAVSGLNIYIVAYVFGLKSSQIAILVPIDLAGSVLGALAAMHIARWLGKRNGAILALFTSYVGLAVPLLAFVLEIAPPRGSTEVLYLLGAAGFVGDFGRVAFSTLMSSMMLDLVEDMQLKNGGRSEGLLLSADNVLQKAVAGLGIISSGLILAFAGFPDNAKPGKVAEGPLDALAATVAFGLAPVYLLAAICLLGYRLTKSQHEANVANLGNQRPQAPQDDPDGSRRPAT